MELQKNKNNPLSNNKGLRSFSDPFRVILFFFPLRFALFIYLEAEPPSPPHTITSLLYLVRSMKIINFFPFVQIKIIVPHLHKYERRKARKKVCSEKDKSIFRRPIISKLYTQHATYFPLNCFPFWCKTFLFVLLYMPKLEIGFVTHFPLCFTPILMGSSLLSSIMSFM